MKSIISCMLILAVAAGFAACGNSNASGITTKKVVFTTDAPTPIGPYSQGILFGDTLYCAGQIGIDPNTGELVEGGVGAEADQVIKNLGAVLKAANMSYDDVVMATMFLRDLNDYSTVNEVYAKYFNYNPPARQTVEVSAIPGNANVEISVIAMKSSN
ncbi:MAG: RidA family protein [Pseudomonadota bacterium]